MNIAVYYFSGTGNTEIVSEKFADILREKGHEVRLRNILLTEYGTIMADLKECDLFGAGYPIYGMGTPRIIHDFVENLPLVDKKPFFLYKTAADFVRANHAASYWVIRKLRKKGFDVFYDRIFAMGSNWFIEYDHRFVNQLYSVVPDKLGHAAEELTEGTRRIYKTGLPGAVLSAVCSFLEEKCGAAMFGASLYADNSCIKCGKCEKGCPAHNISIDDKVSIGAKCIMCMRCVYSCPVKAIKSRGMGFCIIKNGYDIKEIIKKSSEDRYVTENTTGYFRHFHEYLIDRSL